MERRILVSMAFRSREIKPLIQDMIISVDTRKSYMPSFKGISKRRVFHNEAKEELMHTKVEQKGENEVNGKCKIDGNAPPKLADLYIMIRDVCKTTPRKEDD
ncbi:hypothetical protein Ancab_010110 [Ancistrocladus abbreviatus]